MSRRFFPAFSAIALAVVPLFARSQSAASSPQQLASLDPVVVTASRFEENLNQVPANVRVITSKEIEDSPATNIIDVLSQLGGLPIRGTSLGQLNLGASVDIGGYGATSQSNTVVLLDGQRLSWIDQSDPPWEALPLNTIQRIEILHGGAGVQFGNGAVGGVINIITFKANETKNSIDLSAGSFGTAIARAALSGSDQGTSVRLFAKSARTDGWRDNSQADAHAINGRLTHSVSKGAVFAEVFGSTSRAHLPGGVQGKVGTGDRKSARFNNLGSVNYADNAGMKLGTYLAIGAVTQFEGELSYRKRDTEFYNPFYGTSDSWVDAINGLGYITGATNIYYDGSEVAFTPRFKFDFGGNRLINIGYDFSNSRQKSNNKYSSDAERIILGNQFGSGPWAGYYNNIVSNLQRVELENHSVYAIARTPLNSLFDLSGGVRRQIQFADSYNRDMLSASDSTAKNTFLANAADLSISAKLTEQHRMFFKINRAFRFANIDEFWGWNTSYTQRIFVGSLRPQYADTLEVGSRWITPGAQANVSLFQSTTKDEIRYNPATGINSNTPDDILRKGVVFDVSGRVTKSFNVGVSGRYQSSSYDSGVYSGSKVALAPDFVAGLRVGYRVSDKITTGITTNFVSRQYYDVNVDKVAVVDRMPSYTFTDFFAAYRSGPWETRLLVKNLLNANYATYGGFAKITDRNAQLTPTEVYYYYPSDPRAVYLSLRYQF